MPIAIEMDVLGRAGVGLELLVAPAAAAEIVGPLRRVGCGVRAAIELVGPCWRRCGEWRGVGARIRRAGSARRAGRGTERDRDRPRYNGRSPDDDHSSNCHTTVP